MEIEKATCALLSAFPTIENFTQFASKSQNAKSLRSLVDFAYRFGIIKENSSEQLEIFIQNNAIDEAKRQSPTNMNFETFFEQKDSLLNLTLSTRALTDKVNAILAEYRIELPKVGNSMLTRLKKEPADTPHKQNVLRSLAFWLGYIRKEKALQWNFEVLRQLCNEGKPSQDHKEGVRIGFALFSRGEIIDHETMGWLKKNLRSYIQQDISQFSYGRWGKVRSYDITTLYVDLPKEASIGNPAAYKHCLRCALSLAHQISLRWALCPYRTQNRFLSIGISVGEYEQLDKYLYPILIAKLPSDPVIRLTDYARQCILINGIRVIPCSQPVETTIFNGETLTIWWVISFWSTLYFDFIPELLTDETLNKGAFLNTQASDNIWFPDKGESETNRLNHSNAISTYFKFPQDALLGIEIAKTLYYRFRFWEALEIIRIVLSLSPINVTARTLRMVLLSNLALHAPSHATAQDLFTKAHNEARFIQENCSFHSEDFYCGYAWVCLTQAMINLRYLRSDYKSVAMDGDEIKQSILTSLDKADALFGMGETVSSSGLRSYYLQISSRIIKAALQTNPQIFTDPKIPIDTSPEVIRKTTREFQWEIGEALDYSTWDTSSDLIITIFRNSYLSRSDTIALSAYKPSFYFGSAAAMWDFPPLRTVGGAKIALRLLQNAVNIAETLKERNIGIYAFTRTYGEMMPAEIFIEHMSNCTRLIKEYAGENLLKRNNKEIIRPQDSNRTMLLSTLNF